MSWLPDITYGYEWDGERLNPAPGRWTGQHPDHLPGQPLSPRCGKPIILDGRFERGGIPGDPGHPPVCGRPVHDNPPCRSEEALARYAAAQAERRPWLGRPSRAAARRALAGAA